MKKNTTKVLLLFLIFLVGIVGYYAYLSGQNRSDVENATMTEVQLVLSRDLAKDYPATVKEVVKYYTQIQKCYYGGKCTEEELKLLGAKAWELFDLELQWNNPMEGYITNLQAEVLAFQKAGRVMTSVAVAASTNVDFFTDDGFDFARIHCGYGVMENNVGKSVKVVYLLRRDADRKWRIYGWDYAENVNP